MSHSANLAPCPSCRALNSREFDRCIRCGRPLGRMAGGLSAFGRRIDGENKIGTKFLFALTALVFVGQVVLALKRQGSLPILSGGHPADALRFGALLALPALVVDEPWRLLSAVLVHFGLLHFGMNMLALVSLARVAEPMMGTARFVITYVLTGIGGFALTVVYGLVVSDSVPPFTAGASGAVFGIDGVILGVLLKRRDPRWKTFAFQGVMYSLMFGFAVNQSSSGIMINNTAHVGGLLIGIVLGLAFASTRAPVAGARTAGTQQDIAMNGLAALSVLACLAAAALPHASPLWPLAEKFWSD